MAGTIATPTRPFLGRDSSSADVIERAGLPAHSLVCALTIFLVAVVLTTDFTFDTQLLMAPALVLLGTGAIGMYFRRYRASPRFGSGLQAFALFVAMSVATPFCAVIAASSNLPLVDEWLAQLDRTLFFGFERHYVVELVVARPTLVATVQVVYHSLIWQPLLLGSVLFTINPRRGWSLLFAWGLTLTVIIAIFPFFPAAGAPPYFLDFVGTFNGARDGTLRLLGQEALRGIVTFPSFHAAAGVLLAWGWSAVSRIGGAFVILNIAMIGTALIAGHYLVDLVAGALIAGLVISCSQALQCRVTSGRSAG
jgi:hypothetical protein